MDRRVLLYFQGKLTATEASKLLQDATEDPELKADLLAVQNVRGLVELYPALTDREEGARAWRAMLWRRRNGRLKAIGRSLLKYAAVLLAGFFVAVAAVKWHDAGTDTVAMQELLVPQGQHAQLLLSDGSKVWVNAGSRLRYPSRFDDERRIELQGEALFDVAKDSLRPFIVSAGGMAVKVLGTKFDVRAYADKSFSVSLLRGLVHVYREGTGDPGVILHPNECLTMAGDQYVVGAGSEDVTAWTDGIIVFRATRMADIIKELQSMYNVRITVRDRSILDFEYSGKFRQRDGVMAILQLVSKVHPFHIAQHEEKNEIILY